MDVASDYRIFWAKSGDEDNPRGHPLIAHMLDTAAVARVLILREPRTTLEQYARGFGLGRERALRLASFLAGLHDLGKATAIFQSQWPAGAELLREAGLSWPANSIPKRGDASWVAHGVLTEVLAPPLLKKMGVARRAARQIGAALGAHHGFIAEEEELDCGYDVLEYEKGPWPETREALVGVLRGVLQAEPPAISELSPETSLRVMALASFADWVASSPQYFSYGRSLDDPGDYFENALTLAERALNQIRWYPRTPLSSKPPPFESVFPFAPNSMQRKVIEALESVSGPALMIIEAPMGGGKTEAAMYAHLVLQSRNGHRGLYVAMPTTATGNAMFQRVEHDLLKKFGDRPHDLQLVHGASFLNPEYLRLKNVGEPGDDDAVAASEWFSAKKRAMLTEYGVGTIDQALLGVLRVRHHFIRLWGLGNRTVVLDEVHAYDAYTSRLITGLVRWLCGLGSSVIIMSATLTRRQREQLIGACEGRLPEREAAYPRITVHSQAGVESLGFEWPETRVVQLRAAPREPEKMALEAAAGVSKGGVAALIVNTVDRAQRAYRALGAGKRIAAAGSGASGLIVGKRLGDLEVYLFHARFPSNERAAREGAVLRVAGKNGVRPRKALVIATQVIEQSLDLDFDVMYTDLAPIDLLVQRAGRLHRHAGRARPEAHSEPRLHVAGINSELPESLPEGWALPYLAYPLLVSWLLLSGRDELRLPDDIEPLIEAAYAEETLGRFGEPVREVARENYKKMELRASMYQATAARAVLDPLERLLERQVANLRSKLGLDDDEDAALPQVALTRLGEPSVKAVPAFRLDGELFLDRDGRQPLKLSGAMTADDVFAIASRFVNVSRRGVYHALVKQGAPKAWRKSSLLRSWRVLELDGSGRTSIGNTAVSLDSELGLVYATQAVAKEG